MINKFYSWFDFKVAHINPILRVASLEDNVSYKYLDRYLEDNGLKDNIGITDFKNKICYYLKLVEDNINKDVEDIEELVNHYQGFKIHKFEKNDNDKLGWSFNHTYNDSKSIEELESIRLKYWSVMNKNNSAESYLIRIRDLILAYLLNNEPSVDVDNVNNPHDLINLLVRKFNILGGTNPYVNRIPINKITVGIV